MSSANSSHCASSLLQKKISFMNCPGGFFFLFISPITCTLTVRSLIWRWDDHFDIEQYFQRCYFVILFIEIVFFVFLIGCSKCNKVFCKNHIYERIKLNGSTKFNMLYRNIFFAFEFNSKSVSYNEKIIEPVFWFAWYIYFINGNFHFILLSGYDDDTFDINSYNLFYTLFFIAIIPLL